MRVGLITALMAQLLLVGLVVLVYRSRISQRVQHERALEARVVLLQAQQDEMKRSCDLLHATLDVVAEGIVVCDEHGVTKLRNAVAQVFTEARHGDVLVEQAIDDLLAGGGSGERRDVELMGPPKRVVSVGTQLLLKEDRVIGSAVLVEDISERRHLDLVRKDLVANISHELKTPVGALGLLAETIASEEDPEVIERLSRRMTNEAFRIARMIEDLLDLSRIESDEANQHQLVHLTGVIDDATKRVAAISYERSISLDLSGVNSDLAISVDSSQLVSAIGNLLENACKYSDDNSTVKVSTEENTSWIDILVEDEGPGIPARDLERIFERFYRVDRARSRDTGGTGLGLSIVRHVATNHGGKAWVESIEGQGSRFIIRLPKGVDHR